MKVAGRECTFNLRLDRNATAPSNERISPLERDINGIPESKRLGIVPFGDGRCAIKRSSASQTVRLVEHYFSGQTFEQQITPQSDRIELDLQQTRNHQNLTWLEIIFAL